MLLKSGVQYSNLGGASPRDLDEPRKLAQLQQMALILSTDTVVACTGVTWVSSTQVTGGPSLATTRPNHIVTVVTLSMELEAKPRSSRLGLDLISDTGISAGSRRPSSGLIRTCVDDVGRLGTVKCIDDGGSLKIGPDCIQRPARMIISVGAMPCVI